MRTLTRPSFRLRAHPITPLLDAGHPALSWAVGNDLLDQHLDPRALSRLGRVGHAATTQKPDGSWTYPGGNEAIRSREYYDLLATYRHLLVLVSQYRVDRRLPMVARAVEYVLGFQTPAGDIRGIYGTQYSPNYTADILRLAIEAGYQSDPRILHGLEWLLAMRQDDGGWAVPARTASDLGLLAAAMQMPEPVEPVRSKPSSHVMTGIVLRAFAAHPVMRHRLEARAAAELLASRFFQADAYIDRRAASYWTRLTFPFRWTDVVSSLDSIARVGIPPDQDDVATGLRWLRQHQLPNGLWPSGYPNSRDLLADHWVTFAAARVIRLFFGAEAFAEATQQPLEAADAAF